MDSASRVPVAIRRRTVAALAVGLGAIVVAGVGSMTSAASASDRPVPADFGSDPCDPNDPLYGKAPCWEAITPLFTTTVPLSLVDIPDQQLVDLVATDDSANPTTPTTATTAPTGEQPATTAATGEPPATSAGTPTDQPTSPPLLDLQIRSAVVTCDGRIQIAYDTIANPDSGIPANHLVVLNPVSNPAAFLTQELTGRPANGAFVFEALGSAGETYRAFVVALFEPAVVEGAKLIDQADVLPATDCG